MQKGFGLIAILIVVGIIAVLGVSIFKAGYMSRNVFVPTSEEKSAIKQAEEMKNLLEKKNDETADWKTYRNEEYGFEVRYPEDWILMKRTNEFIDLEKDGPMVLSIQVLNRIVSKTDLKNTATLYDDNGNSIFISDAFFTADSPTRTFKQIDENMFNQIISTFKFIK